MRSLLLIFVLLSRGADGFVSTLPARPHLPSAATAQKLPACALSVAAGRQAIVDARRAPLVRMTEEETALMKETALRSFVKAAGWRFTAGVVTAATSFIFTGASCLSLRPSCRNSTISTSRLPHCQTVLPPLTQHCFKPSSRSLLNTASMTR